jgi:hypothetical protein
MNAWNLYQTGKDIYGERERETQTPHIPEVLQNCVISLCAR